jgi:CxxC motif-containing protein (DUF1111 family)
MRQKRTLAVCLYVATILSIGSLQAQTDPGPRGGPAGAGSPVSSLDANTATFFATAKTVFSEVDSVSGTIEAGVGLGPTFNGNGCAQCHAEPAVGGSSPGLNSKLNPVPNPQVALATLDGAHNTVPSFITANGPIREARFVSTTFTSPNDPANPTGPLDGGVHGLFTIAGRTDAPGCNLAQPNFASQVSGNNVIFRVPTPTFGLGFVEATPDSTLIANLAANASAKNQLGIHGHLNSSGNDGTITRFGWKAQNKSLLIFAAEAYNVEQGVSNEGFPNERAAVAGCVFNTNPEDKTHTDLGSGTVNDVSSDLVNFAGFMRLLAPPTPSGSSASITNGSNLFNSIGCALCHTPTLTTGPSPIPSLNNQTYHPYSDFALHEMGSELADGIVQGNAQGDEFRTAPLWGLGQRLFFMHDGRTSDLAQVIQMHQDIDNDCRRNNASCDNSEGTAVVSRYNRLSTSQKQDILNFLRSL